MAQLKWSSKLCRWAMIALCLAILAAIVLFVIIPNIVIPKPEGVQVPGRAHRDRPSLAPEAPPQAPEKEPGGEADQGAESVPEKTSRLGPSQSENKLDRPEENAEGTGGQAGKKKARGRRTGIGKSA